MAKHNITIDEEAENKSGEALKARNEESLAIDQDLHKWMPNFVGKSDSFYVVEASPKQLAATIKELASAREGISSVSVAKWMRVRGSADAEPIDEAQAKDQPQPKDEPKAMPSPAPAPATEGQPLPAMDENEAKSELLSPRPTERRPAPSAPKPTSPKTPLDDKKPAATDPADRRDRGNAKSTDRAVRILRPEGKASEKPAPQEVAPTPAAPAPPVDAQKSADAEKSTTRTGSTEAAPRRALFVLRTVPAPVPVAAPAPAAPAEK